jgi:hypothetical protein
LVCDIIEERAKEKAALIGCDYVTHIKDIKGVDVITIATPQVSTLNMRFLLLKTAMHPI